MKRNNVPPQLGFRSIVLACMFFLAMATGTPAADPEWLIAVDVPAPLDGVDRLPNEFLQTDGSAYALVAALPPGTAIGSLDLRADGAWLFSPTEPVTLDGTVFEARDVIAWDGLSFFAVLDGSIVGIPDSVRIDALDERLNGSLLMSFDVPTTIGAATYSRIDIAHYAPATGFSSYFNASAAGVPAYANLIAAGIDGAGDLVLAFDVPTQLGGTDFLPGQLVRWDGSLFSLYAADPAWPRFAQARGVDFYPTAGAVPNGGTIPGTQLMVEELPVGDLLLTWGASCLGTDFDYEIYRGLIGDFTSHTPELCTTGGATTAVVPPLGPDEYFIVVPRNAWREGSHGVRSNGKERPPGPSACLPKLPTAACP